MRAQIWALTDGAVLWRVSPPLFYAMVNEVWKRTVARHGAVPADDADVRLVISSCIAVLHDGLTHHASHPSLLRQEPCTASCVNV